MVKENMMSKIVLNTLAPDFTLDNFLGESVSLSSFKGQSNILLVFNRGFT
jgi:peroxiredoxin